LVKEAENWAEADSTFAWMALMVVSLLGGYGLKEGVVCWLAALKLQGVGGEV
jgi:hypothetical protein